MTNVLFNRDTLRVTGFDRTVQPFEVEIQNVSNVEELIKNVSYKVIVGKLDSEGNQLYLLSVVSEELIDKVTETSEVTEKPVLVKVYKKVPLLDEDGEQKSYERQVIGEVTEVTDEPVMVYGEEGNLVHKVNDNNEKLYYGFVNTGEIILCYIIEEVEEQKIDTNMSPLYYKTIKVLEKVIGEPVEITLEDERYVEGLYPLTETLEKTKTIQFSDSFEQFDYDDIVNLKETQCTNGTFYIGVKLFETTEGVFDKELANYNADLGFNFISIPSGGQARTVKLLLSAASKYVGIKTEVNVNGLTISIGNLASDLKPLDKKNEVQFDTAVTEVYVLFKNTTDKRIDLYSFALLV